MRAAVAAPRARAPHRHFDLRPIGLVLGLLLVILAAGMLPPLIADIVSGHPDWRVFLISSAIALFVGVSLLLVNRAGQTPELSTRQTFMLTAAAWICLAFFASVPFLLSELDLSLADAFFESMSGITTTGSTVIIGLDFAPPGILLWRSILQWLGGIGIIVMGVAILPILSVGGMQLFRSENSDRSDKVLPRAAQIATAIGIIYVGLTALCAALYWLLGMTLFDAASHAMTTIATGGYSTYDASIGFFSNPRIEWVTVIFMLVGGIPFVLYVHVLRGRPRALLRDVQVRWFLTIVVVVAMVIALWLHLNGIMRGHDAFRHSFFTTAAVITGTGYASIDYGQWGTFPIAVLFFLKCVGGCTGSTTGGLKVFRFVVLYQVARLQIHRLVQPSGVFRMTYNGRTITEDAAISVMAFFFIFALSFAVVAAALSALGLDYLTAMSASITALANVGPGLGDVIGPSGNFATLPDSAKWVLSAAMLLGRLELFTILVMLSPLFWRS